MKKHPSKNPTGPGTETIIFSKIDTYGADNMIHDDKALKTSQQRIAYFQDLLLQLRVKATPEEFSLVSSGYRAEIEKMQAEVLEYLTQYAGEPSVGCDGKP